MFTYTAVIGSGEDITCGLNQVYKTCGTACPASCNSEPSFCTEQCVAGCFCQDDFVLESDTDGAQCIHSHACPGKINVFCFLVSVRSLCVSSCGR